MSITMEENSWETVSKTSSQESEDDLRHPFKTMGAYTNYDEFDRGVIAGKDSQTLQATAS